MLLLDLGFERVHERVDVLAVEVLEVVGVECRGAGEGLGPRNLSTRELSMSDTAHINKLQQKGVGMGACALGGCERSILRARSSRWYHARRAPCRARGAPRRTRHLGHVQSSRRVKRFLRGH